VLDRPRAVQLADLAPGNHRNALELLAHDRFLVTKSTRIITARNAQAEARTQVPPCARTPPRCHTSRRSGSTAGRTRHVEMKTHRHGRQCRVRLPPVPTYALRCGSIRRSGSTAGRTRRVEIETHRHGRQCRVRLAPVPTYALRSGSIRRSGPAPAGPD